jgi:transcriptional regulator GlxA family with amidase domain
MTSTRPRIALLAAPATSASVLYGLYDILISVGAVYPDMTTGASSDSLLDVSIVAATREPFRCFGNVLVEPHRAVAEVEAVDVAIVCDMYTPIHDAPKGRYAAEIDWLRRMHERGSLIASVCSGSLVLAESGLLDGRTCTGHWAYDDLFRTTYPQVRFRAETVLDLAEEANGIVTAGGVTAWHDLVLYLIARYCGPEHAIQTAKIHLLDVHQDGQRPFSAMTRARPTTDAAIRRSIDWIENHFGEPNPVMAMAERSGLSRRTFARRFSAATGRRPIDYVHALRIEHARLLIERGSGSIDDIGFEVGYEDAAFFRRLFKRATGTNPAAYRRRYVAIVAPSRSSPVGARAIAS